MCSPPLPPLPSHLAHRPGYVMPVSHKLQVCADIAQQLATMHDAGIALLDVKVMNVLVVGRHENGVPKLKVRRWQCALGAGA